MLDGLSSAGYGFSLMPQKSTVRQFCQQTTMSPKDLICSGFRHRDVPALVGESQ